MPKWEPAVDAKLCALVVLALACGVCGGVVTMAGCAGQESIAPQAGTSRSTGRDVVQSHSGLEPVVAVRLYMPTRGSTTAGPTKKLV